MTENTKSTSTGSEGTMTESTDSEAGGVGRVDYFEIGTPQPQAAREFYGGLFGWPIGEPSTPAQYSMVDESRGGLWDTSAIGGETWAIFYVRVADVRAAIDRAQELGASVAVPFVDNGGIEFAHLVDPLGNRFGIWRPKDAASE